MNAILQVQTVSSNAPIGDAYNVPSTTAYIVIKLLDIGKYYQCKRTIRDKE